MVYKILRNRLYETEFDDYYRAMYKMIVKPLWLSKPATWEYYEWLNFMFQTHIVTVDIFKATRHIYIKTGKEVIHPKVTEDIKGTYKVLKDSILFIRRDIGKPDVVEVEAKTNRGWKVFMLTDKYFSLALENRLIKTDEVYDSKNVDCNRVPYKNKGGHLIKELEHEDNNLKDMKKKD